MRYSLLDIFGAVIGAKPLASQSLASAVQGDATLTEAFAAAQHLYTVSKSAGAPIPWAQIIAIILAILQQLNGG